MIAQIFVDGRLLYDSRLPEESGYLLEKAEIQETLNKGGTATIVVPRIHPLHGSCRAYSVPVEIYKDGRLRWRGRPLPPSSNFYLQDQIVCEGEFCFLNDAVIRPFSCVSPPGDIFRDVIAKYNASMTDEPWKQFAVGRITVSGGEIPFNIEAPEKARATVERLIELCGGYVLFDSAPDGRRQINYLSSLPYICNQRIQFGSNLTDYASTYDNPNFSTRLIPYGAMGEDKTRLKINIDGRDFVENTAARQTFGVIEASAVYDGITSAQELQAQAERDVAAMSTLPQIVELGAVDLSRQDATLDAFCIGQVVPCYSVPHGMDGTYALLSLQEDLINPGVGKVALSYEAGAFSQPSAGRTFSQKVASGLKKNSSAAKNV